MSPELLPLIGRDRFYKPTIIELGARLPPDDTVLAGWIDEAARGNNIEQFVFLVYAALAAGRKLSAAHLVQGLQFLPNESAVGCVAWKMEGDVSGALVASLSAVTVAPGRQAVALLAAACWCQEHGNQPLPTSLIPEARRLARTHWKVEGVSRHLNALNGVISDAALQSIIREHYPKATPEKWSDLVKAIEDYRQLLLNAWRGPILDQVLEGPAAPSRILASGQTMRRAVARVGRNEPCPCGSGRKYKQCCQEKDEERLHHSSHVAGKTVEEVAQEPEPHLTLPQMKKMPSFEMARLDPLKIKPDLLEWYFVHLAGRSLYAEAIRGFEKLGFPEDLYDAWAFVLFQAAYRQQPGPLSRLLAMPAYREKWAKSDRAFGVKFMHAEEDAAEHLRLAAEEAARLIDSEDEEALEGLPFWLLRSKRLQTLGVFVARGVIPLLSDKKAAAMLKHILELRDELNLAADDPFSDIIDKRLLKERAGDHDGKETGALRAAEKNLEKKAEEVRELKEALARVQRDVALREKKAREAASPETPAAPPSPEEVRELSGLREKLDGLKSALKQTHGERNVFRRELETARQELEELRAKKAPAAPEPADNEEALLWPEEISGTQPVRLLEFPRKFDEVLRGVPRHIARNTMVTLGQIAGGDPAGFVGARRLNVCEDITRQRIGSDYRLLFRLLPDRVQVVTLINRRDLDRTIKTLS